MAARSSPPSLSSKPPISSGVLRAMKANAAPAVPSPHTVASYEVRVRRSIGDSVFLVGHDRAGSPLIEIRIQRRHMTAAMVRRVEVWCRENDVDPAELKILT